MTLYLTDVNDRPLVNPVRQEVFGDTCPASTLVEISALVIPGAKIEVEAIAVVPTTGRHEIQLESRPVLSHSADAVRSGDLLFVAGVLPVDRAGQLVGPGDVGAQARRVFGDLGEILAAGGCAFGDVAKLTVYVTDIRDAPQVQMAQQRAFGRARAAGALIGVRGLAVAGATIEVDAVAVVR